MDLISLEEHFGEELTPCYDRLGGDGLEVQVGRGPGRRPLVLQVFPDTQIARVSTGLSDLTLRQSRVVVNELSDALELQGTTDEEWVRIRIERNGGVVFASFPNRETPRSVAELVNDTLGPKAENGLPAEGLFEGSLREGEDAEEKGASEAPNRIEQERVSLIGRVGTEPRFRTTRNDKLVCNFPLAVHDEAGTTTWHRIVVFGERALKLQDSLQKGQEVEVVGYVHVQEKEDEKTGEVKQNKEVWAAVVKKPKAKE